MKTDNSKLSEIHYGFCKILHEERITNMITLEELAPVMQLSLLQLQAVEAGIRSPIAYKYYAGIKFIGTSALDCAGLHLLESSKKLLVLKQKKNQKIGRTNFDALGVACGFKIAA